jgi:hypothetical protein
MMLVTFAQAAAHLRRDTTADDADLTLKIEGASKAVMNYIQGPGIDGFTDSAGDVFEDSNGVAQDVPRDIQSATLLLLSDFYNNRTPTASDPVPAEFGYGYLPRAVVALLYPYRSPSLA